MNWVPAVGLGVCILGRSIYRLWRGSPSALSIPIPIRIPKEPSPSAVKIDERSGWRLPEPDAVAILTSIFLHVTPMPSDVIQNILLPQIHFAPYLIGQWYHPALTTPVFDQSREYRLTQLSSDRKTMYTFDRTLSGLPAGRTLDRNHLLSVPYRSADNNLEITPFEQLRFKFRILSKHARGLQRIWLGIYLATSINDGVSNSIDSGIINRPEGFEFYIRRDDITVDDHFQRSYKHDIDIWAEEEYINRYVDDQTLYGTRYWTTLEFVLTVNSNPNPFYRVYAELFVRGKSITDAPIPITNFHFDQPYHVAIESRNCNQITII